MPRSCTICAHEETAAISRALGQGGSKRAVADQFGVTTSAVQRHRANCLGHTTTAKKQGQAVAGTLHDKVARFDSEEPITPDALFRRAGEILDDARSIVMRSKASGDDRMTLQGIDRVSRALDLLMRAKGMFGDGATINIDARKQSIAMLDGKTFDDLLAIERALERVTENETFPADPVTVLEAGERP